MRSGARDGQSRSLPTRLRPARGGAKRAPAARACSSSSIAPPRTTSPSPTTAARSSTSSCGIARWSMCPGAASPPRCSASPPACRWRSRPTGAAGLCWHEGELELAKAAAKAEIPLTLSTASMTAMEKIAGMAGRRRRPAVVPALCLEAARAVAPADRARQPQRVRGADRHGGFTGRANREYNTHNGFACRSIRRCASRFDMHAPSGLGTERAAEILHLDRACRGTRTIPPEYQKSDPQRRRQPRRDARRFARLERHGEVPRHVAGHPDAERRQPPGRRGEGDRSYGVDGIDRVEPWRAATWTAPPPRSTCCRRSPRRWAIVAR